MTTKNSDQLLTALRGALVGRVESPDSENWSAERLAWHTLVPQEPVAVVHVAGVTDVRDVVRIAAEHGFAVSPQPRGHGATAHTADDTVVLRFEQLNEIQVTGDTVRVGAGVSWHALNAALDGTGLTSLPGSNGDTSVIGYTVSGGLSWFGRKYGLAAHQIRAIELVDAKGTHRRVTAESDADLFWAVRGGGGEFGIVTALELQLLPAPQLFGGRQLWAIEHGRDLLRAYVEITRAAPEELSLWVWLMNMPDIEPVPAPLRGRVMVSIGFTYLGDPNDTEKLLAPLYAVAAPEMGGFGPTTTAGIAAIAQEPDDPMPAMGRTHLLNELGDDAIDTLLHEITSGESPLAAIHIRHLGGALSQATIADGPAGGIDEPYMLLLGAIAPMPELATLIAHAFNRVTSGLSQSITGRVPMTFAEEEPVSQIFEPAALERLRRIKDSADPTNLFRSNHPF